jgi:hypothetical protein
LICTVPAQNEKREQAMALAAALLVTHDVLRADASQKPEAVLHCCSQLHIQSTYNKCLRSIFKQKTVHSDNIAQNFETLKLPFTTINTVDVLVNSLDARAKDDSSVFMTMTQFKNAVANATFIIVQSHAFVIARRVFPILQNLLCRSEPAETRTVVLFRTHVTSTDWLTLEVGTQNRPPCLKRWTAMQKTDALQHATNFVLDTESVNNHFVGLIVQSNGQTHQFSVA